MASQPTTAQRLGGSEGSGLSRAASASWAWLYKLATRKPLGFFGLMTLVIIGLAALFAPWVAPYNYATTDFGARLLGPTPEHWFGTDNLGRDLFSRVIYGARVSL